MKTYEDEAFDELEKAQQRKVATGVTDGSKVTIDRAKLEQVLEALLNPWEAGPNGVADAIITLKEALGDV
jgi:hypothetical protein